MDGLLNEFLGYSRQRNTGILTVKSIYEVKIKFMTSVPLFLFDDPFYEHSRRI